MSFKIDSKYLKSMTFCLRDFFLKINPERLKFSIKTKKNYIKRGDKRDMMRFIYRQHLINVLNDCVYNKTTYVYNTKLKYYSIQCEELPFNASLMMYKKNRLYDWEPINSYNKAYGMTMTINCDGYIKKKLIRCKNFDREIVKMTNEGKRW